jgi:hypothetical protein
VSAEEPQTKNRDGKTAEGCLPVFACAGWAENSAFFILPKFEILK